MATGMTGTRTYRLASNFRVFLGVSLVVLLVVIGMIALTLVGDPRLPEVGFFLAWLAFVLAGAVFSAFRAVISITIEDGTVTFRTLLRTIRLPVSAIRSVEASRWDMNRFNPLLPAR